MGNNDLLGYDDYMAMFKAKAMRTKQQMAGMGNAPGVRNTSPYGDLVSKAKKANREFFDNFKPAEKPEQGR